MKKQLIILITTVIISLNLSAQSKDTAAPKVDSSNIPLLSVNDINNYLQQLSETNVLSPKSFSQFMQILQQIIAIKQKELSQTKKK